MPSVSATFLFLKRDILSKASHFSKKHWVEGLILGSGGSTLIILIASMVGNWHRLEQQLKPYILSGGVGSGVGGVVSF